MSELIPSKTKDEIQDDKESSNEDRRQQEINGDKPPHHDQFSDLVGALLSVLVSDFVSLLASGFALESVL